MSSRLIPPITERMLFCDGGEKKKKKVEKKKEKKVKTVSPSEPLDKAIEHRGL